MSYPANTTPNVLVVDDIPANLVAMQSVLQGLGVNIIEADNGNQALQLTLKHDFALVLLDVQMPNMDGYEVAELMRGSTRTKHVPIIFVTARSSDEISKIRGYETGAVDYITKPINKAILRSKVKVFLDLYNQKLRMAHLNSILDDINMELMSARREAEEHLRANNDLFSKAGHDIHHFTNDILSKTQLLLNSQLTNEQQHWAEAANESGEKLLNFINHLIEPIEKLKTRPAGQTKMK